jgi:hypothetical protein
MLEQFTLTFLMNILIPSSGLLNKIQVNEANFFLKDSILGFDIMLEQFTLTFLMNILIPSSGLLNKIQVHTEAI